MTDIKTEDMVALPIIFGSRRMDDDELHELCSRPSFCGYYPFSIYAFWHRGYHHFTRTFQDMKEKAKLLDRDNDPYSVFIIMSGAAAKEAKAWITFINELKSKRENIFVYPIIWGSYYGRKKEKGDPEYLYNSGQAVRLYFNGDAPTAGARRVSEYMYRIMGYDLESGLFPRYDIETASKIAKHINRENFNSWGRKSGTIPKYPIRDGKPYFPILSVDIECPKCGKKKKVHRLQLDDKGGATTKCYHPDRHEIYHKTIGQQFDPWPELEEYLAEERV